MTTPTHGFPFPTLGDVPNVPADMQALAEAVDATMPTTAAGVVTVPAPSAVPGGTGATAAVTFPEGRFSSPPAVSVTVETLSGNGGFAMVSSVTATGCTIGLYLLQGSPVSRTVHWHAQARA